MPAHVLYALGGPLPPVLAVEVPVQHHRGHTGPDARRPGPGPGIEIRRRAFAGFELDGALEPVAVEQTEVVARQAGLRVRQDGFQAAAGLLRLQPARQDQGQAHDAAVRVLRARESQRRHGQVRRRARLAVPAMAAEPLRGRLLQALAHQQAAQRRRELERCREGYTLAGDRKDDEVRVEHRTGHRFG